MSGQTRFGESPLIDSGIRVADYGDEPKPDVFSLLDWPVDAAKIRQLLRRNSMARRWKNRRRIGVANLPRQTRRVSGNEGVCQ